MSKKRKVNPRKPKVKRAVGYKPMGKGSRKPNKAAGRTRVRKTSTSKYGKRKRG